jgi:hypothetical protein
MLLERCSHSLHHPTPTALDPTFLAACLNPAKCKGRHGPPLGTVFLGSINAIYQLLGLAIVLLGQEGISKACLPDISFLEQQIIRNIDFYWLPDPRSQNVDVTPFFVVGVSVEFFLLDWIEF